MARATQQDVAFQYLSADSHPDHDTRSTFRQHHLKALAGLFVQTLQFCQKPGLVKLGRVAIDGTYITANASNDHKRRLPLSLFRIRPTLLGGPGQPVATPG